MNATYRTVIAKAKRYGDTKRGPFLLRFFESATAIRVEVQDADASATREVTLRELGALSVDQQTARLCEVIDQAIHAMRLIRQTPEKQA